MNKKFLSNPITIRNGNQILDTKELELDFDDKVFSVKIEDAFGKFVFDDIMTEDTFITLDISMREVTFTYSTLEGKILNVEKLNLLDSLDCQKLDAPFSDNSKKDVSYRDILDKIKSEMDNPKGLSQKEIEYHTKMLSECVTNKKAREYVQGKIRQTIAGYEFLTMETIETYTNQIYADFYGMGIIQELDDNPKVGEILVNGRIYPEFQCDIYYYIDQEKHLYEKSFKCFDDMYNVFQRAIAFSKKELNNVENAVVEATSANRDRVNVIIPDASENYVLNIRKFGNFVPDNESMKKNGTVDEYIENLMKIVVKGKANIGIGGEMGTGKTTFINYLLTFSEKLDRKVIIGSVSETDIDRVLKGHDIVLLSVDDTKGFSFERLIRAALRTTASRIIIPESRGAEIRQVYEANLKTRGNMFTGHGLDAYSFLEICVDNYSGQDSNTNYESVKNKLAKSLDLIIIMRTVGNKIRIKSISEVCLDDKKQFEKIKDLYYWKSDPEDITKGEYIRTENRMSQQLKRKLNEFVPFSEMTDL